MIGERKGFGQTRNQLGIGLISVILGCLVVAIIVVGMLSSLTTLSGARVSRSLSIKAELVGEQLKAVLSSESACRSVLFNESFPGAMVAPIVKSVRIGPVAETFGAGQVIANDLEVVKFELESDPLFAAGVINFNGAAYNNRRLFLNFQVKKQGHGIFAPLSNWIKIPIQVNEVGGLIVSCAAENPEIIACAELGGRWNSIAPTGQRCTPDKYCQFGGSYSTAPLNEGGFVNFVTGGYSCPVGYQQQITGQVTKAYYQGKRLQNQRTPVITCQRCNEILPLVSAGTVQDNTFGAVNDALNQADAYADNLYNQANNNIVSNLGSYRCSTAGGPVAGQICDTRAPSSGGSPDVPYSYDYNGDGVPEVSGTCTCP